MKAEKNPWFEFFNERINESSDTGQTRNAFHGLAVNRQMKCSRKGSPRCYDYMKMEFSHVGYAHRYSTFLKVYPQELVSYRTTSDALYTLEKKILQKEEDIREKKRQNN